MGVRSWGWAVYGHHCVPLLAAVCHVSLHPLRHVSVHPPVVPARSCKGTIDDIYVKLKKVESDKAGGTATVQRAIEQV